MRLFGGVMNRLCGCHPAASSSYLTGLLRRNRHQGSNGSRRADSRPTLLRQPVMQMKPFHAAAVILAVTGFGVGQSPAQTNATVPGSIGATSPLGAGFSDPAGSSQSAAVPYSGGANLAPCSAGSPVMPALPMFDGVGMNQATSSVVGAMPGAVASVPCNSVSTSGVMSSSNNSGTTATSSSSSTSSSATPTTATANSTPNAAGVGVAGLGMNGLGITSLGTTGLGAVGLGTIQPGSETGSASQPSISSTVANGFQSPCAAPGGPAPNLPQSGSVAIPDPAQTLGGSASVPSMPCPNPGPATGTSAGSSMISE
jgi:hypothetical protein